MNVVMGMCIFELVVPDCNIYQQYIRQAITVHVIAPFHEHSSAYRP
jgi:hypothetical protein